MSMNLYVKATVDAMSKVGLHKVRETFDLW